MAQPTLLKAETHDHDPHTVWINVEAIDALEARTEHTRVHLRCGRVISIAALHMDVAEAIDSVCTDRATITRTVA